ncbi:MAG: sterol desaturase family protein [Hydrococcus sp. Prado102]|jgi:sterol desaturase/sphingolipid hydroxylase (fatty acid hydroxylase superfamily)|nr:sterol desaturase family protein [Hydrococcus sp. Prado102]
MEFLQGLQKSIYETFVYAFTAYFRYAILGFLIFWIAFKDRLVHFRIQPRPRTKSQVIFREIGYNFLTFFAIGISSWIVDTTLLNGRYGLFYNNSYKYISDYGWIYFILSVFLLLVFEDTYFYWAHRFLHLPKVYNRIHKIHHYSVDPNPFTTYSFHPLEAAILFFGQVLATSIIPVHDLAVSIWLLLTLLNSIIIHLGYEIYPRWFTQSWLTNWKTPSTHHNMHHEKFHGNYGLIFTWWDKLMRTEFSDYQAKLEFVQKRKITFLSF